MVQMKSELIYALSNEEDNFFLEIFKGRNQYTKKGFHSGQLRKIEVLSDEFKDVLSYINKMNNVVQIGKNKYLLGELIVEDIIREIKNHSNAIYYRAKDKRLRYIRDVFIDDNMKEECIIYDEKKLLLVVSNRNFNKENSDELKQKQTYKEKSVIPILYLEENKMNIRGKLYFKYGNIEIASNSNIEHVDGEKFYWRNKKYEEKITEELILLKAHKSVANEWRFSRTKKFYKLVSILLDKGYKLYWGSNHKKVSNASVSMSISYNMDWFSISGKLNIDNNNLSLSDALKHIKSNNYIEVDNNVCFLPKEILSLEKKIKRDGKIEISKSDVSLINNIAEKLDINPNDYWSKIIPYEENEYKLDNKWKNILKPYQKDGVNWIFQIFNCGFSCCLADDMGLGKTIQAISFLEMSINKRKSSGLIVVPKIVIENWKNEISKFASKLEPIMIYGEFDYSLNLNVDSKKILISTYETVVNHLDFFMKYEFSALILDEAHYVKNITSRRRNSITKIRTKFKLALTGTPIENNLSELWSLMDLLNPGLLGHYRQFMRKYSDINIQEKHKKNKWLRKLIKPFILRRTKDEVLRDLPPKKEKIIYCEMDENQRKLYNRILYSIKQDLSSKRSRFEIFDNAIALKGLLYLRETCDDPELLPIELKQNSILNSCKEQVFLEFVKTVMDSNKKIIVYSLFPRILSKLGNAVKKYGWPQFYIDGTTVNRQNLVDEFEKSDEGIFFISLKAGGVGLNLVSCQYVLLYEPWWNIAAEEQATNRIYRIGQEKPVFIYRFITKDSIEEKMHDLQIKKSELFHDIFHNDENTISLKRIYKELFT